MSKFSSYKQSQLLFENWRKHVNEGEEQLEIPFGKEDPQAPRKTSFTAEDLAKAILGGYLPYGGSQSPEDVQGLANLLSKHILADHDVDAIGRYLESLPQQQEDPAEPEVDPDTPEPEPEETPTPEPGEPKLRRPRLGEQQELDEQSELPPEASEILNQLKAMKTREPEAFAMAMGALQSMGEGV